MLCLLRIYYQNIQDILQKHPLTDQGVSDIKGFSGIILCMCPANERRRYIVTSSLIGWAHHQNDPWIFIIAFLWVLFPPEC